MTDPTIPELVARLRELHGKARLTDALSVAANDGDPCAIVSEDVAIDVYSEDFERGKALAALITEATNALPTLLDALERGQDVPKAAGRTSKVRMFDELRPVDEDDHSPDDVVDFDQHVTHLEPDRVLRLYRDGGKGLAKEPVPCTICAKPCALYADEIPPDGLCPTCRYSMAPDVHRLHGVTLGPTWRPITQAPTAGEHRWCKGRYLFEGENGHTVRVDLPNDTPDQVAEYMTKMSTWLLRWLPIPPSVGVNKKVEATDGGES